jgi:hypothetical protein
VLAVVPVAHAREVAVGAGLARVLGRGLTVHLQHAGAGLADHAAQQVHVVDLAGRRRRLVGLVEALQDRRQQPLAGAEQLRGRPDVRRRHRADLLDPLGRVARDCLGELLEPERVLVDVVPVDPLVDQQLPDQAVHQRQVRPAPHRQVDVGVQRDRSRPGVDGDHARGIRATPTIQHPRPQHGLGGGGVVPPQGQRVAVVDVRVGGGLAIGSEARFQRRRSRRGAQARVAVHVRGADPGLPDHGQRVVLLEEQLSGGVEAELPPPARLV